MLRRSQLFVPANDEKKLRKSVSLEADSVILDLEDAVPIDEKSYARATLSKMLSELDWGKREVCVRINKVGSDYSKDDVAFVKGEEKISGVVLPKTEEIPKDLQKKTGKILLPLIETAMGVLRVEDIVRCEGVGAVSYGPADLAYSVGGRTEAYSGSISVKTSIVIAASAYGVDALDGVFFGLEDLDGFRKEAMWSRDLGFVGKHVIHPSQISVANDVYTPSKEEIASAKKLAEAYENAAKGKVGAIRMEGKLVDAVHYKRAKAILERAERIASS